MLESDIVMCRYGSSFVFPLYYERIVPNRGTKRVTHNGRLSVIVFNDGIDGLLIQIISFWETFSMGEQEAATTQIAV